MATGSPISWLHRPGTIPVTLNVALGCDPVSPGCDGCYAPRSVIRQAHLPGRDGLVQRGPTGSMNWTGKVITFPNRILEIYSWRAVRTVFVNALADLFHDKISDEFIAELWAAMATGRQHLFIVLTKRHGRMRSLLNSDRFRTLVEQAAYQHGGHALTTWPLPNVVVGVSAERQDELELRIPALLETQVGLRAVSIEPQLGETNLTRVYRGAWHRINALTGERVDPPGNPLPDPPAAKLPGLDWVIIGGESGPAVHDAAGRQLLPRPMRQEWALDLLRQCHDAGVPAYFKQLGTVLAGQMGIAGKGEHREEWPSALQVNQFPEVAHGAG